jgi:hypothetical protein
MNTNTTSDATTESEGSSSEHWWPWVLSLVAIALPIVFLLAWYSIDNFAFTWQQVNTSVRRGEFIVPVLILCLETIRRWCWVIKGGKAITVARIAGSSLCILAAFLCLVAMNFVAKNPDKMPVKTGDSIALITISTFVIAAAFGTYAVAWSTKGARP